MLQQLLHIIVVSAYCITWGMPVLLVFEKQIRKETFWFHSRTGMCCFLFFSGGLFISVAASWVYLFAPLKFFLLSIGTIFLATYLLAFQRSRIRALFSKDDQPANVSAFGLVFIILSMALFVLLSALQPVNGDTQIYHLQIIRWQTEYKAIPGLANLYPRLGLGSAWFNLISFFYWPSAKHENFTYVNAAFVAWFFTWLFLKWRFYLSKFEEGTGYRFLALFYLLLLFYNMFDWQLFRDAANSTNYDFAVNALTMMVSAFFVESIFRSQRQNNYSLMILVFTACCISFKLSGIFLVILLAFHFFSAWKSIKWTQVLLAGFFILFPVMLKNYVTSGYPLFPSLIAVNSPDWQLPPAMATGFYHYIILANRFYNYKLSFIASLRHDAFNWIPYWFHGILLKHKIILLFSLSMVLWLFRKPGFEINTRQLRWLIICLLAMIAGWFFTAPDPGRFGYGVLLTSAFLTTGLLFSRFLPKQVHFLALLLTILVTSGYAIKKSAWLKKNPVSVLTPVGFELPPHQIIKIDSIGFQLPGKINDNWDCRCYFTPLPCITQKNPYLHPRGERVIDGFRMSPTPDSTYILNYIY